MSPWLFYLIVPAGLFGVVMMISALFRTGDWMLVPFGLAWCGALGWNLYFWGFRTAYKLQLRGGELEWFKPFGRGTVAVADIGSVATSSTIGRRAFIMLNSGDEIIVRNFRGFDRFLVDLVNENPAIAVDPADLEPWLPSLPGGAGRYLNQETNNRWK